jgi:hypothetical protein
MFISSLGIFKDHLRVGEFEEVKPLGFNALDNQVIIRKAYKKKRSLFINFKKPFKFSLIRVIKREVFPFTVESGADFEIHRLLYKNRKLF